METPETASLQECIFIMTDPFAFLMTADAYDPATLGLPAGFVLTRYSKLKG